MKYVPRNYGQLWLWTFVDHTNRPSNQLGTSEITGIIQHPEILGWITIGLDKTMKTKNLGILGV